MSLPRPLLLSVVALVAVAAAACSDDDPNPTNADPSSTVSAEPTSEPTSAPTTEPSSEPTSEPTEATSAPPTGTPSTTPEPTQPTSAAPTEAPVPGPTSYAEAQALLDAAGQEPQTLRRFETESGTYCLVQSSFLVGCELLSGGIPDPDYCGDGPSQNVGRVTFGESGVPTAECNSDTIREPGARTVRTGSVVAGPNGAVQCLIESAGVTCIDVNVRAGYFLGVRGYTTFTS